jgi:hypothetical protein
VPKYPSNILRKYHLEVWNKLKIYSMFVTPTNTNNDKNNNINSINVVKNNIV